MKQNAWECWVCPKFYKCLYSVSNATLNSYFYFTKTDITTQYNDIISTQNAYDNWNFSIDEMPNFQRNSYISRPISRWC